MSFYAVHRDRLRQARALRRAALKAARPAQRWRRRAKRAEAKCFLAEIEADDLAQNLDALRRIMASLMR